jgi:Ca2+-binding EF-hand superfamily protein
MLHADNGSKAMFAKLLKEFNKKISTSYYATSVNSVQIHQAMTKFNWSIKDKNENYAKNFVLEYDIDGDGRLNARELILGSIKGNRATFNNPNCLNCYSTTNGKIDAIFKFFNCAKTGMVDAEQLWNGFPLLKRDTSKYNIFGIQNVYTIRTNSINDFVLKNQKLKDGYLTNSEFREGILLGFWDRQTTESGIIDGDSRNLKSLRWSNDGSQDTLAYNYMKETIILELKQKAEERAKYMVNFKKQKESKVEKNTTVTN